MNKLDNQKNREIENSVKFSPNASCPKLAFSRDEAAAILGISKDSLDRLVKRNLIHPSRALRRPMFSLDELQRFMAETQI